MTEPARSTSRPPLDSESLQAAILAWYDARGRTLPFRGTRDPYAILVSETMAQQTQIGRVGPAWVAFVGRFPTFEALAAASPADVQRAWHGLGYNRRALNLQRAARAVAEEHGGRLPRDIAELERLPGIGPYTARAVAAIAFGERVGAVDTNVRRVLGRVVTGDHEALRPVELQTLADELVPPGRAADWTHAVMDVGATFCRRTRPSCPPCPARPWCSYGTSVRDDNGRGEPRMTGRSRVPVPAGSRPTGEVVPFARTNRWLRGRILDRVRDADGSSWTGFESSIGSHPHEAVVAMMRVLGREGLLELAPDDECLARLPHELPATGGGASRRRHSADTAVTRR